MITQNGWAHTRPRLTLQTRLGTLFSYLPNNLATSNPRDTAAMPDATTGILAILLVFILSGCAFSKTEAEWVTYSTSNDEYALTIDYPSSWSVTEDRNLVTFRPPKPQSDSEDSAGRVEVIVFDLNETPRPPVEVTYTTIRSVTGPDGDIAIQKRDPAPYTERSVATISADNLTAEIRSHVNPVHDATYDRMVASFSLTGALAPIFSEVHHDLFNPPKWRKNIRHKLTSPYTPSGRAHPDSRLIAWTCI